MRKTPTRIQLAGRKPRLRLCLRHNLLQKGPQWVQSLRRHRHLRRRLIDRRRQPLNIAQILTQPRQPLPLLF